MKDSVKALMIGDIVGNSGLRALYMNLPTLIRKNQIDFVVVNAENAASGVGLLPEIAEQIFNCGVNVITSGNHIWQKREILPILESNPHVLRPHNYPTVAKGSGFAQLEVNGIMWAVLNLQGREGMTAIDCPFKCAKDTLKRAKHANPITLVDFHAEAVDEKEALALYLDGEVSAFSGTHTHVQTADERILPKGTGYITDLGMTGPKDSVIGVKTDICVKRCLLQMPLKMETSENEAQIHGAIFTIDTKTKKTLSILRLP